MNILTQTSSLPLATVVNPPTDSLRRENSQREVITQPTPTHQSAAEKGVASDKERARTPAQNNEQVDFAAIQKKAEKETTTIGDPSEQEDDGSQSRGEEESDPRTFSEQGDHEEHDHEQDYQYQKEIRQLETRDREVRAHERAHDTAGGAYTGAPSYDFEVGPDGKKYAVSGEVSVDLSPVEGNPRATIAKMQKVRAAALAPANPSIQDTKVAASAQATIVQAQAQLAQETQSIGKDDAPEYDNEVRYTGETDTFRESGRQSDSNVESGEFDQLIESTLAAQESVAPARDERITQAANVIATLYTTINQAYDKPPKYQFDITA